MYKRNKQKTSIIIEKNEEINRQRISELFKEYEIKAIRANINGQENERKRIAEELHDGIGGTLSSIKLSLANSLGQPHSQERVTKVMNAIDELCYEIRTISHNLIPPNFKNTAFVDLLNQYFEDFRARYEIELNIAQYPNNELNEIPLNYQVELYRIIQEALTNIVKHAQADTVEIQLIRHDNYVNLIIEDNGVGFEDLPESGGIGLRNMHSRVHALQGNFEIDSKIGRGTIINIDLQLKSDKTLEIYAES